MSLAETVERQSRAIILLTVILSAAGLVAVFSLPSDIYPPLVFPRIVIIAQSGTTPGPAMMLTVTRPLEQALMEVPGIRRVRSTTFRGNTEISGQFDPSTDMIVALSQAQGRIGEIRQALPAALDLTVERLTPTAFPFYSLILTGALPPADLHDYGFYVMRPAISRVAGVGSVDIVASDTREIEVIADPGRLTASGLTIGEIADGFKATNDLLPVGRYNAAGLQHLVLASGLWKSIADIPPTPIAVRNGTTLRVADVATVQPGTPDRTRLVAGDGVPAAEIAISQQLGANILQVRAGIEQTIAELTHTLPAGLRLTKVYDLAEFVSEAIRNVRDAILLGGLLAVIVLLLFLRDWRLTIVASITLPLTVLMTFLVMRLIGETINVMSMGGLAVAIGLVIDDAVVMVENIYRHLTAGQTASAAVAIAMDELIAPVVGSTVTTVVVFVPLSLLSGVVGQFFRALSLTLAAAVLISLVQALTLIPLLARYAARRRRSAGPREPAAAPGAHTAADSDAHATRLDRRYARSLHPMLGRPALTAVLAVALALGGYVLFANIGTGFLPEADEGGFVIDYHTPPGSSLAESDRLVKKVEAVLRATPDIASFSRRTGSELGLFATQQNKGDILTRLEPRGERRSAEEVIEDLRDKLAKASPEMDIEFVELLQDQIGDLEGAPTPIEVKVFGDDSERLAAISDRVETLLAGVAGVVDIVGVQRGNPETTWHIDAVAAGRLGLTLAQVSEQLSDAFLGDTQTALRLPDRTVPVRVRYPDSYRMDPVQMAQIPIRAPDGRSVPLASIARATSTTEGELVLQRENLRQMALLTASVERRDLGSAVADIQAKLRGLKLPVGYTTEVGGQYASAQQSFHEMLLVFAIAAGLVFIVLVVEFRRFVPAILILLAAPLSLGGAFGLLLLTGTDLNVASAMGLILLVGLVVKNGIVMLDYTHRLERDGLPFRDALEASARIRLRPILMTTLCTLFGLLPLALGFGAGAELQQPLALAVIGGLSLSTLVTLYMVPAAYSALHRV
ncbi:MAG TPA: efflux RND transporter permease subunit [Vicinamibacterales bacterium]|nr:efflux RND transporter permease subunit [Vicinamibacterales bacterium]